MAASWATTRDRFKRWETYTHHFVAYILHSEEGRHMRARFIRQIIYRALLYFWLGAPLYFLLYWLGWVQLTFGGPMIAFMILDLDIALGAAVIRTIADYRHRVELLYRIDPTTGLPPEEEMPLTHREVPKARPAGAAQSQNLEEFMPPPSASRESSAFDPRNFDPDPAPPDPAPQPATSLPFDSKTLIECTVCQRRIQPSNQDMADRIQHCIYCGGAVRRISA